jgi:IS5 family transposase
MAFTKLGGSCDFGGKKKRREEKREKKGETSQSKVTTYANVT